MDHDVGHCRQPAPLQSAYILMRGKTHSLMSKKTLRPFTKKLSQVVTLIVTGIMAIGTTQTPVYAAETDFGSSNPFYAESTLPFHAPPFDKIKDTDYQH